MPGPSDAAHEDGGGQRQFDHLSVFLSYRHADGSDLARRLHEALRAHGPHLHAWWDNRIPGHEPFDRAIERALAATHVMVLILTPRYADSDYCREELAYAQAHRDRVKVIVVEAEPSVDRPYGIYRFNPISFADGFRNGMAELLRQLDVLASSRTTADLLEEEINAVAPTSDRAALHVDDLHRRRQQELERLTDPQGARSRVQRGIDAARELEVPTSSQASSTPAVLLVNDMPAVGVDKFRERREQIKAIDRIVAATPPRLAVLCGPAGSGKTAVLARLRDRLAAGKARTKPGAVVYLAGTGHRPVTVNTVLGDLCRAVRDEVARANLERELHVPGSWRAKLDRILGALDTSRVVLIIDDAHELVAGEQFRDAQLNAMLARLLRPGHGVRLVLAGMPGLLALGHPFSNDIAVCELNEGLPAPADRAFLADLDRDGILRLTDDQARRLYSYCAGHPRCLELFYATLRTSPNCDVDTLLDQVGVARGRPDDIASGLLNRVIQGLDPSAQRVLQAIAVFERPVRPAAVDFVLQDYVPGLSSAPILHVLENRRLIRRDDERYFVPGSDAAHICGTVPAGDQGDFRHRSPPLTLRVLRSRAADYYREVSLPPVPTEIEHLQPRFEEISLRILAGQTKPAHDLMVRLDEEYLVRWGRSDVLIPWWKQTADALDDFYDRAVSLSHLVAAETQQDPDSSGPNRERLAALLDQPWMADPCEERNRIRIRQQIAGLVAGDGYLTEAAATYLAVAAECAGRPEFAYDEASALGSAALHLARTGRFEAAVEHHRAAAALIEPFGDERRYAVLASQLSLNLCWTQIQLGDVDDAALVEGARVARRLGLDRVHGTFLDSRASVLCYTGRPLQAAHLAREAATLAHRTGNSALIREANSTLALACLFTDRLDEAERASRVAGLQPVNRQALGALTIRGVVAYRRGDEPAAARFFSQAYGQAVLRIRREPEDFPAFDMQALATCGLALCESASPDWVAEALALFRRSVQVTSAAGVRRRRLALLDALDDRADQRILDAMRRAVRSED